ncbi:hypothetical protein PVAND_017583 [Polypedilum vanderplanki]|uniref:Uncharacterized protein n=1 Tax=Polypedilum vanderplanki TaxID=319348 RepID=A0A9J6BIQ8_POLVA|nr:hypothetical protein PVAND_017583 [Polypedilum vanderplanki]
MAPISPISNLPSDDHLTSAPVVSLNTTLLNIDDDNSIQDATSQHVSTFSSLPIVADVVEQTARILEDIKRKIQLQKEEEEEEERLKKEREISSILPETAVVTTTPSTLSSTSAKSFIILNHPKNLSLSPDSVGTDYPSASSSISPPFMKSKENVFTTEREILSTYKKTSPKTQKERHFSFDEDKVVVNELTKTSPSEHKFSPMEKKFFKVEYLSPIKNFSFDVNIPKSPTSEIEHRKSCSDEFQISSLIEHKKDSPTDDRVFDITIAEKYRNFNFDSPSSHKGQIYKDDFKVEHHKSMKDEFLQRQRVLSECDASTVVRPIVSPIKRKSFILENDYSPLKGDFYTIDKFKSTDSPTKRKSFILEDELFSNDYKALNFEQNKNSKLEKFSPLEREIFAAEKQILTVEHQKVEDESIRFKCPSFTLPLTSPTSPFTTVQRRFSGVNVTSIPVQPLAKSTPSICTDFINERPISFTVLPNLENTYQSVPQITSPYKSTLSCSSLASFSTWNPTTTITQASQVVSSESIIPSAISNMISQNKLKQTFGTKPSAIKPIVSALEYPAKKTPSSFPAFTVTSILPKSVTSKDKIISENINSNTALERYNKFIEKQKIQIELQQQQQQAEFLSLSMSLSPPMNRRHKDMPILRGSFVSL